MYPLRYLPTGHIFISPGDDCDKVVDAMLDTDYSEEFCLARDFEEDFIRALMEAGFLVMSTELKDDDETAAEEPPDYQSGDPSDNHPDDYPKDIYPKDRFFILLPKLHLIRSVLFFPELHIKKRIRPLLSSYELRIDTDFNIILDKCLQKHGEAWLTPPLVEIIKNLRKNTTASCKGARPFSFALYRDGELKAGEFGIVMGRVYTSYSGYYDEDNAGTVQMILMVQWMEKNGFDFLDFGMPLDYKSDLGAQNIDPRRYVELFRKAKN